MRAFSDRMWPNTLTLYPKVDVVAANGSVNFSYPEGGAVVLSGSVQPKSAYRTEPDGAVVCEVMYHVSLPSQTAARTDDKFVFGGLNLQVVNPPFNRGGYSASWLCVCKEMGTTS